jgi:hypothetical protein
VVKLHLPVLLDSGSDRSLISVRHYQQLTLGGPEPQLIDSLLSCVTASGQNLDIIGEIQVALKLHGFPWRWSFLVSKRLQGQSILGTHFMIKTRMVLDLARYRAYFAFARTRRHSRELCFV